MKVLHILNELKHSGAEVMLQLAYCRFKNAGIEPHILSTGDKVGEYASFLRNTGYRVHHIPFRRSAKFVKDIWKFLENDNFTAVHIHPERAFFWYVLMAKLAGVQNLVRTFHSVRFPQYYLRWKKLIQRKISKNIFYIAHVAISDSVLTVEKERFYNDCILIRNWTDVERFRPPSEKERSEARRLYDLEPGDFVVVTVGACISLKNHLSILTAVKKANDCLDRKKVVLLHVGEGPKLEEEQLYVSHHGIEQQFRFIGTVNDVRPCLYAADAFVMTSQWEGLGMAAVEAMSTSLPTILYNVYGLRDLLQDGKGGLLIEPKEDDLVEALLLMSRSPELREQKAQEARQIVLTKYSLENSVDKLIGIYTTDKTEQEETELHASS